MGEAGLHMQHIFGSRFSRFGHFPRKLFRAAAFVEWVEAHTYSMRAQLGEQPVQLKHTRHLRQVAWNGGMGPRSQGIGDEGCQCAFRTDFDKDARSVIMHGLDGFAKADWKGGLTGSKHTDVFRVRRETTGCSRAIDGHLSAPHLQSIEEG